MTLGIVDPRERPHQADAVAERIWKHQGTPFAHIRYGLAALLKARPACRSLSWWRRQSLRQLGRPALREFYTGPGWRELESEVGQHRQVLYARELGAVPSRP